MSNVILDPAGCKCADCLLGKSSPIDDLEYYQESNIFDAIWFGAVTNRSGETIELHTDTDDMYGRKITFGGYSISIWSELIGPTYGPNDRRRVHRLTDYKNRF